MSTGKRLQLGVLAFLCIPVLQFGQENRKTDSLLKALAVAQKDTNQVQLLYTIAEQFEHSEPEKAKSYVRMGGDLSRAPGYEPGIWKFYRMFSYISSCESKFDSVYYFNKLVFDIARERKDSFNIGVSLFNPGIGFRFMSELYNAVLYTLEGARIPDGKEKECTRLAKDLHDGLGEMLSGIKYSFQTMKGNLIMTPEIQQAFERSMDMLDSSIKEMRRVAHNMMPEALVKFGLDTALRDFCEDINRSGALKVTYQSIGMQQVKVDQTAAITIYRITQELLNTAMNHAGASTAIVQLSKTVSGVDITVEDDGTGFDTSILKASSGIGWSNILSRVEYLNGRLDVQSVPGKGTSVHIEIDA